MSVRGPTLAGVMTARPRGVYAAVLLLFVPVGYFLHLATSASSTSQSDGLAVVLESDGPPAAAALVLAAVVVGLAMGVWHGSRVALWVAVFVGVCGFFTQGITLFRLGAAAYGASLLLALWLARSFFGLQGRQPA